MHVQLEDLDVEIIQTTPDTEDDFDGRRGWFWHDSRRPPTGPFPSAAEALSDLATWFAQRQAPAAEVPDEDLDLARHHLETAAGFLSGPRDPKAVTEADLHALCVGAELTFKAWLLSRGAADDDCRTGLGHDLARAYAVAALLGLPEAQDARVRRFAARLAKPYATHGLIHLGQADLDDALANNTPLALRLMHRAVAARIEDDLAAGLADLRPRIFLAPPSTEPLTASAR